MVLCITSFCGGQASGVLVPASVEICELYNRLLFSCRCEKVHHVVQSSPQFFTPRNVFVKHAFVIINRPGVAAVSENGTRLQFSAGCRWTKGDRRPDATASSVSRDADMLGLSDGSGGGGGGAKYTPPTPVLHPRVAARVDPADLPDESRELFAHMSSYRDVGYPLRSPGNRDDVINAYVSIRIDLTHP